VFAIFDAYKAGLWNSRSLIPNIMAGLIVGVVALPLAMAFAIASGAKPEQGIYTAIVAGGLSAIFGGSRVQISGPTGAFVVILANITATYGFQGLQVATLLAGAILILMGLLRFGNVIKFIPYPVIAGFTMGIGVLIFVGQWKEFLGLTGIPSFPMPFYEKLWHLIYNIPTLDPMTSFLGSFSLAIVIGTPKFIKHVPGSLVALIIATLLQITFDFQTVATIGSVFGSIPQHFPEFHLPSLRFSQIFELIGPAFTIALLGAIESLLSATVADGMTGTRHYSNQELIGQGIANIFAPLFGGFAATGALARTVTNIRSGGTIPLASIVHCLVLVFVLLFLAPLAKHIPLCTLAAILFVVAYHMSDGPHFIYILKCAPRYDKIVLLITFFLTIFTDLVMAVNIGVIISMFFFIRRMNQSMSIEKNEHQKLVLQASMEVIPELSSETMVYSIHGPLFFGVAEKMIHVLSNTHTVPKTIVFRMKDTPFMDMTGLTTFREIIGQYHRKGVKVYLCEANEKVRQKLINTGVIVHIEKNYIFDSIKDVVEAMKK
jgi:SulP family sulfate permease